MTFEIRGSFDYSPRLGSFDLDKGIPRVNEDDDLPHEEIEIISKIIWDHFVVPETRPDSSSVHSVMLEERLGPFDDFIDDLRSYRLQKQNTVSRFECKITRFTRSIEDCILKGDYATAVQIRVELRATKEEINREKAIADTERPTTQEVTETAVKKEGPLNKIKAFLKKRIDKEHSKALNQNANTVDALLEELDHLLALDPSEKERARDSERALSRSKTPFYDRFRENVEFRQRDEKDIAKTIARQQRLFEERVKNLEAMRERTEMKIEEKIQNRERLFKKKILNFFAVLENILKI
jgi:hypothetical protein